VNRFTRQDRARAIEILAIEASTPNLTGEMYKVVKALDYDISDAVEAKCESLAFWTWLNVVRDDRGLTYEETYAEAEARLRDGYVPEFDEGFR
jgi:hypothetical protein